MRADGACADRAPIVVGLRAEGLSLRGIADRLNRDGHTTRRGEPWDATQVKRVLARGEGPIGRATSATNGRPPGRAPAVG